PARARHGRDQPGDRCRHRVVSSNPPGGSRRPGDRAARRMMAVSRFFRRSRWDEERRRELDAHIAIEIEENLQRGMTLNDARDAARRKLGNATLVREEIYQMNTIELVDSTWRDLKHAARLLRL